MAGDVQHRANNSSISDDNDGVTLDLTILLSVGLTQYFTRVRLDNLESYKLNNILLMIRNDMLPAA